MSNSDIEQTGTVKGHLPNGANLSGRISNGLSLSGHISIGGAGDFIIKMTIEVNGDNYTVTSCDTTVEQIDAAVAAEKRVVLVASVDGTILELPMVQGNKGNSYYFCAILSESVFLSSVYKIENTSDWSFGMTQFLDITAEDVCYHNSFGEGAPENVGQALDVLITGFNATRKDILRLNKSEHTHSNKSVLDKFAETDGKPTYNGEKISGASTAEEVEYTNAILPNASNVKSALDDTIDTLQTQIADSESLRAGVNALMNAYETQDGDIASLKTQAHTHSNKDTLDKLSDSNGKLQYNGSDVGAKGDKGEDGKTAYQYAQDGGYTGTETEFAEKLAQEQLTGTTSELTPTQVYNAVSAGIPVKVQYLHDVYGLLSFTAFNIAESFSVIVSQTIVYYNNTYILAELNGDKSGNRWWAMFTTLAEKTDIPDIPTLMPNPHALTFTGAVTGNYDGSAPMTVNIPSAVTDEHINSLIDTKLGVIENGSY